MGPCCTVYARCELTDPILGKIAAYLSDVTRPQIPQPRGRSWSIWVFGRPVYLRAERTEDCLWDCEDELLDLGLLPEDAPMQVVLCAGCNSHEDYELLRRLSRDLARILDGVPTEPSK